MRYRVLVLALASALVITACGDDDTESAVFGTTTGGSATTAPSTSAPASSTTVTTGAPSSTAAPATTATTAAPTPSLPTAADSLAAFFAAAEDLDDRIKDAASLFNSQWDPATATVGPETRAAIDALDPMALQPLIPGGLSPDLEVAVLAVFADLDSRVAALDGGARYPGDSTFALDCLGNGGESAERFADDLDIARALALLEPPPTAPPDSPATGAVAVRMTAIHSMDWGCDSCGGVAYTTEFPVDWSGRTVLGVGFDATYGAGGWEILIYAC